MNEESNEAGGGKTLTPQPPLPRERGRKSSLFHPSPSGEGLGVRVFFAGVRVLPAGVRVLPAVERAFHPPKRAPSP